MKRGLILYNDQDSFRNRWFIERCLKELNNRKFSLKYYDERSIIVPYFDHKKVDFLINRSHDFKVATQFEKDGIRCFNNASTNEIANDKYKTYEFFLKHKIPCIKTYRNISKSTEFPLVMKSVDGHGGKEVYLINNKEEVEEIKRKKSHKTFIYQKFIKNSGDLRIYILGNKIIGAVLRQNEQDFRSNYSLGGSVSKYEPDEALKHLALKISKHLKADFIGVDFLKTEDGFIANEIEDPVGSRMLYETSDIDAIGLFIQYIKEKMSK